MASFLTDVSEDERRTLKSLIKEETAEVGAILTEMGSKERDLIFLESGTLEVYQKFTLAHKVFALRVGSVSAPAIIGEANLLLGEKRNATLVVGKPHPAVFYRLGVKDYEHLKLSHPQLTIRLLEEIGKLTSRRFLDFQKKLVDKFLVQAPAPLAGLEYLKKFMGNAHPCSKKLAQKLFKIEQPALQAPFYYADDEEEE